MPPRFRSQRIREDLDYGCFYPLLYKPLYNMSRRIDRMRLVISRRQFFQRAGVTAAIALASGCVSIPLTEAASLASIQPDLLSPWSEWTAKSGSGRGPGPNNWDPNNVSVDNGGNLHLRITNFEGKWYCAEATLNGRLGFGRYQFWVIGQIDQLDPNVVFGMFNYPTSDVGPDQTNEIDIEIARWGNSINTNGNYVVWPPDKIRGYTNSKETFKFSLSGTYSTHRFTWKTKSVLFQSLEGHRDDTRFKIAEWNFALNQNSSSYIPQKPLPVHINLWLRKGQPPLNGAPVEVVVRAFKFSP
jgi:hypothetical protein